MNFKATDIFRQRLPFGTTLLPGLTSCLIVLILFLRKPHAFTYPQLWAEDGPLFFAYQYEYGASALLAPYADYLHFAPHLVALIADLLFPYAWIPAAYNYSALLISIMVVLNIFSKRFQARFKPLLALSIVVVPLYQNEVFLNVTNIQWVASILLILTLLKAPPDRKYGNIAAQYCSDFLIVIVFGLTGPHILILLPFYAWKWFRSRDRYHYALFAAVLLVSLVQLYFIVWIASPEHGIDTGLATFSAVFGQRFFGCLFLGSQIPYKINHFALSFTALAMIALILRSAFKRKDSFTFITIGIVLSYLLAALYKFKSDPSVLISPANGERYFYIPHIMLAWALLSLLGQKSIWQNVLVSIALILIPISAIEWGFQSNPFVDYQWQSYSKSIGVKDLVIPINPPGWDIELKAHPK